MSEPEFESWWATIGWRLHLLTNEQLAKAAFYAADGKASKRLALQVEQIETLTKELEALATAAADLVGYCDNCGGTGFIGGGNELPCAWCTPTRQALASIRPQEPTL